MATLDTKTFDELVELQATAVQAESSALVDYSTGSVPRALAQAFSAVAMWLQAIILQLLTVTRATTSADTDLDSWVADFGVTRLPAVAASGNVTFARYTTGAQAQIPVGTLVQTTDGAQQYTVIGDATQAAYDDSQSAYVIAPSAASISATVQALAAGTAGNASAGAVNTLAQSLSGVDTVANATAFDNGADAEADTLLRTRFVAYLASLSKATGAAVGYAVTSLQQGLSYSITEGQAYDGTAKAGYFYVVIDDGSGATPSGTLASAATAIDDVRACGVQFGTFAPSAIIANIALTLTVGAGYNAAAVRSAVQSAIIDYLAGLSMGDSLLWSRLGAVVYGVEGVASFSSLLVNGSATDIVASSKQVIVAGTVAVS